MSSASKQHQLGARRQRDVTEIINLRMDPWTPDFTGSQVEEEPFSITPGEYEPPFHTHATAGPTEGAHEARLITPVYTYSSID